MVLRTCTLYVRSKPVNQSGLYMYLLQQPVQTRERRGRTVLLPARRRHQVRPVQPVGPVLCDAVSTWTRVERRRQKLHVITSVHWPASRDGAQTRDRDRKQGT